MTIAGILLCGGAARRFGADKLMAGDVPLATLAASSLIAGAGNALAVIPPGRPALRAALESVGCAVVESDRTAQGMGASLAAAIGASAGHGGWIVALGDMPMVAPATIALVRDALQAGALVAAPFSPGGRRGHPVGFSATLRDELLALDGDIGAREVLDRHDRSMVRVTTRDSGIFVDVDTPRDLAGLPSRNR